MTKEQLARINALARKSKESGLSPAEKEEQARLRAAYIKEIRADLTATLENTVIVDEEGNRRRVEKKGS